MTTTAPLVADAEWLARAAALAATVVADGELADPGWAEVFAAVPRHVFIRRPAARSPPPTTWLGAAAITDGAVLRPISKGNRALPRRLHP